MTVYNIINSLGITRQLGVELNVYQQVCIINVYN